MIVEMKRMQVPCPETLLLQVLPIVLILAPSSTLALLPLRPL